MRNEVATTVPTVSNPCNIMLFPHKDGIKFKVQETGESGVICVKGELHIQLVHVTGRLEMWFLGEGYTSVIFSLSPSLRTGFKKEWWAAEERASVYTRLSDTLGVNNA